jgi:hypothetical protein
MLFIVGLVAIVVFTIQVYKTAAGTGRNAAGWAALTAAVGVLLQLIVPFFVGLLIGLYYTLLNGGTEGIPDWFNAFATAVGIGGLVLSFVAMYWIMRVVMVVPEPPKGIANVPPPPKFQ